MFCPLDNEEKQRDPMRAGWVSAAVTVTNCTDMSLPLYNHDSLISGLGLELGLGLRVQTEDRVSVNVE